MKNYLAQSFHAEDIPVERPKSTKIDKWAGKFKPLLSDNERLSRFCNLLSQEHIDLGIISSYFIYCLEIYCFF